MPEQKRYASLDGLRGLCALVVVIYHCLLVVPSMSIPTDGSAPPTAASGPAWSAAWWLYRTPLRVLWAGPEAVLVFFVLSGFVLTLPLAGLRPGASGRFGWPAYYARRVLRLYLPVWGAVIFSVLLAVAVARSDAFGSVWLRGHQGPGVSGVVRDISLVFGTTTVDGPLWSVPWRLWGSLLLPVCWLALRWCAASRWWLPTIAVLAALSAWAATDDRVRSITAGAYLASGLLQYLPVFGIGMVLALNVDRVRTVAGQVLGSEGFGGVGLVGAAALVMIVSPSFPPVTNTFWPPVTAFFSLLGVCVIVVLSCCALAVVRALETPALQWLGARSFSIYLVHEPVVVAAALLARVSTPWPWLGMAVPAVLVALAVAEGFFRLVERPAHRVSRRVGAAVGRQRAARAR